MGNIADDIKKGANWISRAFSGGDTELYQRDIPGQLARWLFRIGAIGAVIQIPITFFVCLYTIAVLAGGLIYGKPFEISREVLIGPYLLTGYAVWVGWGWRSRKPRNMKFCVLFWLASAVLMECILFNYGWNPKIFGMLLGIYGVLHYYGI